MLQRDPGDGSTLADWSARLALDEKTIQRLFHKETGMTFGQWRQQSRLLLALERIAVGEKIIDVAWSLGYDSPSAFTTMFKSNSAKHRAISSNNYGAAGATFCSFKSAI